MTPKQAKQKLAELEAQKQELLEIINSKPTPEKRFLGLINGLEIKLYPEYPDSICFLKKNELLVELNLKNKQVWFDYDDFWLVFNRDFGLNYEEIYQLLKSLLEKHFKLIGFTPVDAKGTRWGYRRSISN